MNDFLNSPKCRNGKDFLIIAGPCSAESREQVMTTAINIANIDSVEIFRSGIWKARTRPGHFEGVGSKGLEWLKEVRELTGLRTVVEVANSIHVDKCLKAGVDMLWIGARTTSNPFSIQDIADALKGVKIPVFVKNPLTPELGLWIGAMERIHKAGIDKIAAIHRGFHSNKKRKYRNSPEWEIVIELRAMFHDLPIICDPSHIAGDKSLIEDLSQKALDLNMDGLMIECHTNPSEALSDSLQQITPVTLSELLGKLNFRVEAADDLEFLGNLNCLRTQIDSVDEEVIELLGKRIELVKGIGLEKLKKNISVLQIKRWEEIKEKRIVLAQKKGLSVEFAKKLLQLVHKESISVQTKIMKDN